jgi:cold-inducible RNA-binding protein
MAQKLYVGNLSYNTTESKLRTLFAEFGEIVSVTMITDRETGRPKGFGFVEMASDEAAQAAIGALNGKMVDDREIKVDKAQPPRDRGTGSRGPGGGRGYGDRRSGDRRSGDRERSRW